MDALRDFLMERIHEEETLAQAAIDAHDTDHSWTPTDDADGAHFAHWSPWRVLASSVAKRLIIAAHRDVGAGVDRRAEPDQMAKDHVCSTCGQYDEYAIEWPCYTLRVLALDWVDHPAYRPEWRPQRLSSGVGRAPAASATTATTVTPAAESPAPAAPPAVAPPAAAPAPAIAPSATAIAAPARPVPPQPMAPDSIVRRTA